MLRFILPRIRGTATQDERGYKDCQDGRSCVQASFPKQKNQSHFATSISRYASRKAVALFDRVDLLYSALDLVRSGLASLRTNGCLREIVKTYRNGPQSTEKASRRGLVLDHCLHTLKSN
jgi:hypothetical protein